MKILHMISSLDPKSGGPTRSVTGLCREVSRCGVDVTLFVPSGTHVMQNPSGVDFRSGNGGRLWRVYKDVKRVVDEIRPDIVHLHCVWTPFNHIAVRCLRNQNVPYIIAPRGMLEPWALNAKKWKKRLAMWLYQRRDLKHAVALHATAASEAEQFRKLGFKQPIIISPNGVDLPETMPARAMREDGKKTILFLSRIHPKKGLLELVEAWHLLRSRSGRNNGCKSGNRDGTGRINSRTHELLDWHIEYAGPDYGGHLNAVQKRIKELGVESDFSYLGDLSDQEKWSAYRRADVFVLPTYSENFGIVVAEALAAGVPVITTKGAPWSELKGNSDHSALVHYCDSALVADDQQTVGSGQLAVGSDSTHALMNSRTNELPPAHTGRAGWWIDIGVEQLAEALKEAMGLSDEERRAMGENGRRLVAARYTWPAIAEQMKAAYAWILNGGEKPDCVVSIPQNNLVKS
jgi:glycosyltransferase involved in cell wall biosynthesis